MLLTVLEQIVLSFIATFAFGIIFNVPRRALIICGTIGASGWLGYWVVSQWTQDVAISNFIGALIISSLCLYFSRKIRIPVIILNTPAIVPLVPGGAAYMAVRVAVEGDYLASITYLMDVMWTAGAIVFGFMCIKLYEIGSKKGRMRRVKG